MDWLLDAHDCILILLEYFLWFALTSHNSLFVDVLLSAGPSIKPVDPVASGSRLVGALGGDPFPGPLLLFLPAK